MKHTDERVALQAVEFWSTVCEEEIELAIEAQEVHFLRLPRCDFLMDHFSGFRVRRSS